MGSHGPFAEPRQTRPTPVSAVRARHQPPDRARTVLLVALAVLVVVVVVNLVAFDLAAVYVYLQLQSGAASLPALPYPS